MYAITAQLYWPAWLLFKYQGHTYLGMVAGVVVVLLVWSVMWAIDRRRYS